MADDSAHEEKSHDEHQTEPSLGDSASAHEEGIPGVEGDHAHADSHADSSPEPKKVAVEKAAKKKLPLKKILLGTSSVLLVGVLALAVMLFLKGGSKKEHASEKGAHTESHDSHADSHAKSHDSQDDGHGETHAKSHDSHADGHAKSHDSHADGHGETHAKSHDSQDDGHAKSHDSHGDPHSKSADFSAQLEHSGRGYPGFLVPVVGPIENALLRIEDKASVIRDALEENRKLRLENANLRVQTESLRLDCRVKDAAAAHERNETALLGETGEKVGRTLASISYRPPRHLDGPQLNTLGLTYLQAGENEKAAVIFTLLSQMALQAEASVKGHPLSKLRLLAGTSWYLLDHLELADQYFSEVLELPETERELPFQAQARLWRAVTSKRLGKTMKSQFWLREVLDRHPASEESKWINPARKQAVDQHGGGHGHP